MAVFGKLLLLVGAGLTAYIAYALHHALTDIPSLPVLHSDEWWGPGEKRQLDESIRPFKIQVADEVIKDLHTSLDRSLRRRFTPPLENQGFQYGFNTDYLTKVIKYWRNDYNWKARETYLNQYPQYKTYIQGLDIHFIRVTPKAAAGKKVLPLLLLHGWPGSVREFYELIPLLTTPKDSADFVFEVIVPSLPGYGFSQGAARPGLNTARVGVIMNNLMKRLGFDKFYVQGGDWGALITKTMGQLYPSNVLGAHSNMCSVGNIKANLLTFLGSFYPPLVVEAENQHLLYPFLKRFMFIIEESGYFHLQATKPDTIGTALSDSPTGLAAYIIEKFSTWTNPAWKSLPDGGLTKKYTLEALLDNIMIYHVTNSITTSQRLYAESFSLAHHALKLDDIPIQVPTACSRFSHELMWQSEKLLKLQYTNLQQITDQEGGHFAAFENPKALGQDIWSAVAKFEAYHRAKK